MSFVKLHGTILDSSIWSQPASVRLCWITLLAMADGDGVVQCSPSGLARRANVTPDEAKDSLRVFLSPDEESRDGTTGERLEVVPGGWLVLNHANYRDRQTRAQELTAARVRKHRQKHRPVTGNSVTPRNAIPPSEAEAEADKNKKQTRKARGVARPVSVSEQIWGDWLAVRKAKRAGPVTETVLGSLAKQAKLAGMSLADTVEECAARGWQSFKAEWAKPLSKRSTPAAGAGHNMPAGISGRLEDAIARADAAAAKRATS
jgi:hypothetical protein